MSDQKTPLKALWETVTPNTTIDANHAPSCIISLFIVPAPAMDDSLDSAQAFSHTRALTAGRSYLSKQQC